MDIQNLAIKHPYYCSESNYYSNEAQSTFDTATEFLDEMEDTDVDMNLVFRWDVKEKRDDDDELTGTYGAEVFIMHQRKGMFWPITINNINDYEVDRFIVYLKKHWDVLNTMWKPVSAASSGIGE